MASIRTFSSIITYFIWLVCEFSLFSSEGSLTLMTDNKLVSAMEPPGSPRLGLTEKT